MSAVQISLFDQDQDQNGPGRKLIMTPLAVSSTLSSSPSHRRSRAKTSNNMNATQAPIRFTLVFQFNHHHFCFLSRALFPSVLTSNKRRRRRRVIKHENQRESDVETDGAGQSFINLSSIYRPLSASPDRPVVVVVVSRVRVEAPASSLGGVEILLEHEQPNTSG